jgi:hypothetical protein
MNSSLFTSNSKGFRKFLKRFILFLVPVVIYAITVAYIDPYNILRSENNKKLQGLKSVISYKINYPLYKINEFEKKPTDIILLGDSRVNSLNMSLFNNLSKTEVSNLAYGGGSLPETFKTFWFATKIKKLKKVYLGINFNLYNSFYSSNRVTEALEIKKSTIKYVFSKYSLKATFNILKYWFVNQGNIRLEKPNMNLRDFWDYQLNTTATNFYKKYKYPKTYYIQLQKIANYCSKNNIELIIFIPPSHIDLQNKKNSFKLLKEENRFLKDLSALGNTIYNFDYPNRLTRDKNNFIDPFHFNDSVSKIIIRELISGKRYYSK